jgi:flavin-dependent dehydrogenase
MKHGGPRERSVLEEGSTIAVIGGGPAGAFFAIHFLRQARELRRKIRVVILERRLEACGAACGATGVELKGCGYSAGGISPLLNDVLRKLNLRLPPEVIQSHIHSITVQGYWKNIELDVPGEREIVSVVRGGPFALRQGRCCNFDAFMLDCAAKEGAELIAGAVYDACYAESRKPVLCYRRAGVESPLEADESCVRGRCQSLQGKLRG